MQTKTAEVRRLLKIRDEAFRPGDKAALKTTRANLSCGIKNKKRSYAQKINNHFTNNRDTWSLWQAIQTITDYNPLSQACDDDTSLPDALNHFYSRFEMQNDTPAQKLSKPLSPANLRKTLSRINRCKAADSDNIPYRTTTGSAPTYFHSLLRIYIPSRSLRSASERRLVVPSQRGSKSLSRTFSFTVPGRWNDLPIPIRNAGSLSIFKQQLKISFNST